MIHWNAVTNSMTLNEQFSRPTKKGIYSPPSIFTNATLRNVEIFYSSRFSHQIFVHPWNLKKDKEANTYGGKKFRIFFSLKAIKPRGRWSHNFLIEEERLGLSGKDYLFYTNIQEKGERWKHTDMKKKVSFWYEVILFKLQNLHWKTFR